MCSKVRGAGSGMRPSIDRCALAPGDFFDGIPEGADIYLLSQIVHDWNDERALRILRNCRRATGRQAKLLLIEQVFDPLAPLCDGLISQCSRSWAAKSAPRTSIARSSTRGLFVDVHRRDGLTL